MNKFWLALLAFILTMTWARADIKISQFPLGTASPVTTYDVFPYSVISPTPTNPTAPVTLKMRLWDLANLFPFVSTYAPIASPTFTGTVSLPSSATAGFCWVATNSSGAGHWATCLGSLPDPVTVNLGGTGATSFTSGLPLLGAGTSAFTTGTLSGNTTEFGTVSGSLTNGHCASFDASGNIIDSGDSCPLGGLGTVTTISVPFPLSVANATTTPAVTWSPFPVSYFLADGPAGAPSPRPIVSGDLPTVLNSVTSASSLATVGTIGTGTWQGTKIGYAYGGTNATTQAAAQANMSPMTTGGDMVYGGASGAPTRLANGGAGQVLQSQGTTLAPQWATPVTYQSPLPLPLPSTLGGTGLSQVYYPVPAPSPSGQPLCTNGLAYVLGGCSSGGGGGAYPLPSPSPSGYVVTATNTAYVLQNPLSLVVGTATNITGNLPTSQVIGVTSGGDASSGFIGEYVSANPGSTVNLGANGVFVTIASISLTAGDWDVEGSGDILVGGASTMYGFSFGISLNPTSMDVTNLGGYQTFVTTVNTTFQGNEEVIPLNRRRINVSSTTTVYLVGSLIAAI